MSAEEGKPIKRNVSVKRAFSTIFSELHCRKMKPRRKEKEDLFQPKVQVLIVARRRQPVYRRVQMFTGVNAM